MSGMRVETLARWACAYSGVVWGVFWMPLREMQAAGLDPVWSVGVFFALPGLLFLPLLPFRLKPLARGGAGLQATAFLAGVSIALYALSVVYTEVIRAILLYYLTPVWSTLLARVFLGERITPTRCVAVAMALAGLLVITGIDSGVPLPRNVGDWLALASGFLWAGAAVRLRLDHGSNPLDISASFFLWATLVIFAAGLVRLLTGVAPLPDQAALSQVLWLAPIILFLVTTGILAAMWGPMHLDPGLVALLFMTEITVGTVTAALWAGEPFGPREMLGVALITGAALIEAVKDFLTRPASAANVAPLDK